VLFLSKVLIFDIDGVVCDCSVRLARYSDHQALERGDYNAFRVSMTAYNQSDVDEDIPIVPGIDLFNSLRDFHKPDRTIFLTSRGEESRYNTLNWLREHVAYALPGGDLIMRPAYIESGAGIFWRDGEPRFYSVDFKRQETIKILDSHDVVIALDDHLPICEMYQSIGVPALHVKWPGVDCISKSGMSHESIHVRK